MSSTEETFTQAWNCHQAGNLAQAEQLYWQVIQVNPSHADAWCFLGAACQAQNRLAEAETHLRRAVQLLPTHASAQNCLGVVQAQLGQLAQAVSTFQQALEVLPGNLEIMNNLGLALSRQGKNEEAIECYRKVLRGNSQREHSHYNLGLALMAAGNLNEAGLHFQEALRIQPHFVEAMVDLGNTLAEQGKVAEAIPLYQQALHLRPQYADAHYNLAFVLANQEQSEEAIPHYQQAVRFKPDFAEAHSNLANLYSRAGRWGEAVGHYYQFLRLKPDNPDAHINVGRALAQQGKHSESLNFYRSALQLNPKDALAHCNVGDALAELHELEQAAAYYQDALRLEPDSADALFKLGNVWLGKAHPEDAVECLQKALKSRPDMIVAQHNLLFSLNHHPQVDQDVVFAEHRRWGELHVQDAPAHDNNPDPQRRLRIGYVSPDFRQHALNRYLQPVISHHDPKQVEVFCYSEVKKPDAVTAVLQQMVHGWCSTRGLSDEKVAEQIRSDRIDILVDLAGHTSGNRLGVLARKPAPIQATWLGYLNTTGLTTVDYRITDEVLDPPGQPRRDTEQLVRLPGGFCCFLPPTDAPAVSPLPAKRRGNLTFGSLHSIFKLNAKVLDLWSEVMRALPTSRLVIFRDTLAGTVVEHMRSQFTERGIGADRLDLRQGSGMPGYLRIYDEIDVSLDVFPWTGGVTTCESLWMGVPMLSMAGVRPAQRNTAAILANVGLSEWAVETAGQYVAKATRLPAELDQLAELRMELRDRMAKTICDAPRFTRVLEAAYRSMWRRWLQEKEVKSKK